MNYIRFNEYSEIIDKNVRGIIKESDSSDIIHIFYDLDESTELTAYRCMVRYKRADGLVIGPYTLSLSTVEFDTESEALIYGTPTFIVETGKYAVPCRKMTLTNEVLGADGDLQVTVLFQTVNESGTVLTTDVQMMFVIKVYDAVSPAYDEAEYLDLIASLMPRDFGDITDGIQPTTADEMVIRQSGATKMITLALLNDMFEEGITVHKKVAYSTTSPSSVINIGETRYSISSKTLETRLTTSLYMKHGQHFALLCQNYGMSFMSKGTPVYIVNADGMVKFEKASNTDATTTQFCIGVLAENVSAYGYAFVLFRGVLEGVNTSIFPANTVLYLGNDGNFTKTKPTTNIMVLGVVLTSDPSGSILINPILFPRPEDMSTVNFSSLTNGDVIVKTTNGWTNYALSEKADISDLEDGTIIVDSTTNDKDGNQIDTTYLKKSGGTMSGSIAMGTNKITGLGDGVADQDGATMKNIETEIATHDESEVAHLFIRQLIEAVQQEVARIDGRGKDYGEIALLQSELLALSEEARNTAIYNDILARFPTYVLANGQLVYTLEDDEENTHEWEYNSIEETWVDNGAWVVSKASDTVYGLVKGDSTYLSIVSGLVQVLKSDYADKIGTSVASYTYAQLLSAFSDRYTKAEVDAIIDALSSAFGWEMSDLGAYTTAIDLSGYDLVLATLYDDVNDLSFSQLISPADYLPGYQLAIRSPMDDSVVASGLLTYNTVNDNWEYSDGVGTNTLYMRGYKIAPIQAENVVYDNSTSGLTADDVNGAIDEIKEDLDLKEIASNKVSAFQETPDDSHYASEKLVKDSLDVVVEETRDVGTTEISFENGKVVAITSDNCTTSLLYGANGNIQKITETYADGKTYETTYTKDVEGRIKTMTKAEV